MKKYISDGTWFDKGSQATLIDDYRPQLEAGLFEGIRTCENPLSEGNRHTVGEKYIDQEVCGFDEFEEIL